MKTIEEINNKAYGILDIEHIEGSITINSSNLSYYKEKININHGDWKSYSTFSKEELTVFQIILLNAYVFLNDEMEEAIKGSKSKQLLDKLKGNILSTRNHLRSITNYIDSYEDLLKEYEEI